LYITLSPKRNAATEVKVKKSTVPKTSVYKDKGYLAFIFLVFVFALCFFQLFTTIPVFFRENFKLSVFFIGMIMALNGLIISFFEMIAVFTLEGRRPSLHYISSGMILVSISFLLLNSPPLNFALIAIMSMIFLTFGEILTMPFMNSWWIGRSQQNNRGQYAALFTVAWASAQAIGPFSGALIAEHFGYNILWYFISGICLLLAFFYRRLR
jgi:predicted MFS family arabinose efflux permease